LHTVDVEGIDADGDLATLPDGSPNPAFDGDGPNAIHNPDFADGGGSPYEGTQMPLCSTQLVTVRNGRSATPGFHFKPTSNVPLPGRIIGLIVDDLNLSVNPQELFYGEKYGIPNVPIGIYDFSNRLVKTVYSDPNGVFEVILPSTSTYNCPLPAGPCPGIYRFLGNDPGQPDRPNPGFNPAYRTIGAFFEVWPGVTLPADLAPSPVAFGIENPGTQQTHPATCLLNDPANTADPATPELFAVSRPFVRSTDTGTSRNITLNGQYFGASPGNVTLTSATGAVTTLALSGAWSDTQLTVVIPPTSGAGSIAAGPYQLRITGSNGQSTVSGITIHVLSGNGSSGSQTPYNPYVYQVGPGLTGANTFDPNAAIHNTGGYEHAIQDALDAAAASATNKLVVVYPGPTATYNPLGSYFENIIIHSPVKLQGVGPGGVRSNGSQVRGSVLDGLGFGTDSARDTGWQATVAAIPTIMGPGGAAIDPDVTAVPEGEVILAVATSVGQYGATYQAAIDGLTIQNGDVMDFVPNVDNLGNGTQVGGGNNTPANPNQGGGVVAFASTQNLRITNNIIRSNAGAYGGAIRLGTPLVGDNNLDNIRIANNRILNNGGSNLAGAVGIFTGAGAYEIAGNDVCGNFSAEYGGGISHFGLSTNGSIHDNRVYFNGSYDEGGGVIVAGEPGSGTSFGAGAGAVTIFNNLIEANLANDDGGGLRFLTAGNFAYNVFNNMIVNNISTHEGGGVAIDNAPNVRFYNNTVMRNITTATAATSDGQPAPAGLATAPNNDFLQATLPPGSPNYSNPLLFNNIFYDNRAGSWDVNAGLVRGIGGTDVAGNPDPTPINNWDIGVAGGPGSLAPTNSIIQQNAGVYPYTTSPSNSPADPVVVQTYNATIKALPWRGNPNFIANVIVAQDVPVTIMGNYHLSSTGSPAYNLGAGSKVVPSYQQPPASLAAPAFDIDNQARPAGGGFDAGADEIGGGSSPPPSASTLYLSLSSSATLPGIAGTVADEDIISFNGTSYNMVFDGSDVVPTSADIDAFAIVNNTTLLMSFDANIAAGGLSGIPASFGTINASDIVQFNATSLGATTAGTFSVFFDGSDVGLGGTPITDALENVDALERLSDGSLIVSINSNLGSVTGIPSIAAADLIRCVGTFGPATSCTWSVYFDGSDVGLGVAPPIGALVTEDVDAVALGDNGDIYLSTIGNFTVSGLSGAAEDVFVCGSPTIGGNTACTFAPTLFFDGSARNIPAANNVDAIDLFATALPVAPAAAPAIATPLLDTFAQQSGQLGSNWRGATANFTVQSEQAQVNGGGLLFWNAASFKANQEARLTFTKIAPSGAQGLLLKIKNLKSNQIGPDTSLIYAGYNAASSSVVVSTLAPGQGLIQRATFGGVSFQAGDVLSAQTLADGTVKVFKNGVLVGSACVTTGAKPWPIKLAMGSGKIGVVFDIPDGPADDAGFDDFGGGTLP
jgi:hypothetical protein